MSGAAPTSSVETFVDDLVAVSKIDADDHHLLDAVIDTFCRDNFAEGSDAEYIASVILKAGLHSAGEDGLTRSEVLAALSEAGNAIAPLPENMAVPTVLDDRVNALAGQDADHLHGGLLSFIIASEIDGSGREAQEAAPAEEYDPEISRNPHGLLHEAAGGDQMTPMTFKF